MPSKEPKTAGTPRLQTFEKIARLNPGLRVPGTSPQNGTECRLNAFSAGLTETWL
ncbi:predicted protein [Sclerotinia sclerotiorum 1980 UF-70]|uniref:Uncharacterized protein n=1 Tax=Sclerotinia sclerotiorum (strain ATCC 18683 / 1980 / Ss-1) TaxID=665079 RepID=A7EUJ0_SCLS1|nr:predicted protein [Sclerotinia sclerotiorum 1980 UF-70]EDN93132.1 predicted protein [Sclerotinia sclerotiorum 1980 UF-70]